MSYYRFSRKFRFLRMVKGCKGPGCSQCRDLPRNQEDSCIPGKYLDDLPISNHQSPLTALLPVDLHWAWAPQGEGTQGSWGTGALSRRTPTAETGPLRRLLTTVRWAEG